MNYAINFFKSERTGLAPLNKCNAEEIILKYSKATKEIINFVLKQHWENKKIILRIDKFEDDFSKAKPILKDLKTICPKLTIMTDMREMVEVADDLGIGYFLPYTIETFSALNDAIRSGVSEVYIGGELGFNLPTAAACCHKRSVKVRVHPNVADRSFGWIKDTSSRITDFFIRPEDLKTYEPYIDTIEFFGPLNHQPTLFKIYKQGYWKGNLGDIIYGDWNEEVANSNFLDSFGEIRLKCGKACIRPDKRYSCHFCKEMEEVSKKLKRAGLRITS